MNEKGNDGVSDISTSKLFDVKKDQLESAEISMEGVSSVETEQIMLGANRKSQQEKYFRDSGPMLPLINRMPTNKSQSIDQEVIYHTNTNPSEQLPSERIIVEQPSHAPQQKFSEKKLSRKSIKGLSVIERVRNPISDLTQALDRNETMTLDIPQIIKKEQKNKDGSNQNNNNQQFEDQELSDKIKEIHEANTLQKSQSLEDQVEHMVHKIPLFSQASDLTPDQMKENDGQGLYKVIGTLVANNQQNFCPILLEITNQTLLDKEQVVEGQDYDSEEPIKRYLLQVWSKQGVMIYERRMSQSIRGWYMDNNTLLFEFEDQKVQGYYSIYALICSIDEPARLLTIQIPQIQQGAGFLNKKQKGLFKLDDTENFEKVKAQMEQIGETDAMAATQNNAQDQLEQSLFEEYQEKLDEQKLEYQIKMNMSILDSDLLFAFDEVVYVIDITQFGQAKAQDRQTEVIKLTEDDIDEIKIHEGFKFINFIDIGHGKEAMLLEHKTSGQLRFFTTAMKDDKIHFIQLGLHQDMCRLSSSKVVKHVSVFISEKKDPFNVLQKALQKRFGLNQTENKENKENDLESHHVTLILRENGRVEVYSDFVYTHAFDMSSQGLFCVDIDHDHDFLYLKYLDLHTKVDKNKFIIRKVSVKWRTRIKYNYTEEVKHDSWKTVADSKFSNYFRLYTKFVNMSIYYLVAHRNYISVFDMSEGKWIEHESIAGSQNIRDIVLQKKQEVASQQQGQDQDIKFHAIKNPSIFNSYHLVVFYGTNFIRLVEVSKSGKLRAPQGPKGEEMNIQGTILSIQDDEKGYTGCFLLVSEHKDNESLNEKLLLPDKNNENYLHQFVIEKRAKKSTSFKLLNFNFSQDYPMHDERYLPGIQRDSEFLIIDMEKDFLKHWFQDYMNLERLNPSKLGYDIEDEIVERSSVKLKSRTIGSEVILKQLQKEDDYIKFFVIKTGRKLQLYPYLRQPVSQKYKIKTGFCIDMAKNQEEFKKVFPTGSEKILSLSFFTDDEYERQRGYSVIVTRNNLCVLDDKFKVVYRYTGLNITAALQTKDYLYTLNEIGSTVKRKVYLEEFEDQNDEELPIDEEKSFSAINLKQLLKGDLKKIQIMQVTSGSYSRIEDSLMSQRLAFIDNFSTLVTMPIPHLNILSMVGMEIKHEYLIWRKSRNGFFTALDRDGDMHTWSCSNGKLLYKNSLESDNWQEKQIKHFDLHVTNLNKKGIRPNSAEDDVPGVNILKEKLRNYRVYRSDKDDYVYTQDLYEQKFCTYQLLVSKNPVNQQACEEQFKQEFDRQKKKLAQQDFCIGNYSESDNREISSDGKVFDKLFEFPDREGQESKYVVKSNMKQFDLYHFEVLKMQTYCDTKSIPNCSIYFHFFHYLFANPVERFVSGWSFDKNVQQRLILSQNMKRLLEIVNGCRIGILYEREGDTIDTSKFNLVSWGNEVFIPNFPYLALSVTSLPSMLSPNFDQMFDFNYHEKSLRIIDTKTQKIEVEVPKDLITIRQVGNEKIESIREVFAKVAFSFKPNVIEIFNDKTKRIIKYEYNRMEDGKFALNYLTYWQLSGAEYHWNGKNHMFFQVESFQKEQVLKRLMRKNVLYKNLLNDFPSKTKEVLKSGNKFERTLNVKRLYSYMNTIDYTQQWASDKAFFDGELTYTILDQCLAQEIKTTSFSFEQLMPDEQKRLIFCIFGHGETFLQMLAQTDPDDLSTKKNSLDDCRKFFEAAANWNKELEQDLFEVPILQDVYGLTPLDYSLGISEHVQEIKYYKEFDDFHMNEKKIQMTRTEQMAAIIFDGIKNYRLSSVSPAMVPAIIQAVKREVSEVFTFLDCRLIKGDYISVNTQPPVNKKYLRTNETMGEYGVMEVNAFESEKTLEDRMFNKTEGGLAEPRQCYYFDVPLIHDHSNYGISFIAALCTQSEKKTFNHESIQIIVGQHWKTWKQYNYLHRGFPLLILIILFTVWSTILIINHERVGSGFMTFWEVMTVLIALYFMFLVIFNYFKARMKFRSIFQDVWFAAKPSQFAAHISPVFIVFTIWYSYYLGKDELNTSFWQVNGFTAILIWFRLLFFLQSNQRMSFIVSMVMACFKEMLEFIFLLFIGVLAFANAILSVRQSLEEEGINIDAIDDPEGFQETLDVWFGEWIRAIKTTYYWSLGNFDSDEADGYSFASWFIFFILTIFNIVILINLLIALVNEIYNVVSAQKYETMLMHRCEQISLCQQAFIHHKEGNVKKLLFVARNERRTLQSYDQNKALIDIKFQTLQLQEDLNEMKNNLSQNQNFQMKVLEKFDKNHQEIQEAMQKLKNIESMMTGKKLQSILDSDRRF